VHIELAVGVFEFVRRHLQHEGYTTNDNYITNTTIVAKSKDRYTFHSRCENTAALLVVAVDTPLTVVTVGDACPDAANEVASSAVKTGDAMSTAAALDGTGVATVKVIPISFSPACMRCRPEPAGAFAALTMLVMLTPLAGAPSVVATAELNAARAVVLKVIKE
jgi:hypothetical protein